MSTEKKFNKKGWITSSLRRMSYRWPPRSAALSAARVERGMYRCNTCQNIFPKSEIKLDHIEPVVSVKDGFTTWDDFINRLLCDQDGYQCLCDQCHDMKTMVEDELRAQYNKERKEQIKLTEREAKLEAKRLKKLAKKHGG